ncbi:hypothetical protein Misp02_48200 [Microtetraspora sp. NBRC 16547]|nr:hypothetical protein Misp02_48200 [Microtetraspora sp. NBRC 16547]
MSASKVSATMVDFRDPWRTRSRGRGDGDLPGAADEDATGDGSGVARVADGSPDGAGAAPTPAVTGHVPAECSVRGAAHPATRSNDIRRDRRLSMIGMLRPREAASAANRPENDEGRQVVPFLEHRRP